jgi:pimeloyl-ACP methyl ester carboxylesterase
MDELQAAIVALFGDKPAAGVFHSLTSIAAVRQVLKAGGGWSKLILFDPPVDPRDGHELIPVHEEHLARMERLARSRPRSYADPTELSRVLASRRQFARWIAGAHDLFARATLRQSRSDGPWELACPREYEAHIFMTEWDATVWPRLAGGVDIPLFVIGADPLQPDSDSPSKVCRALAQELGLPYEFVPDTTHMLQIEAPQACVDAMHRALAG